MSDQDKLPARIWVWEEPVTVEGCGVWDDESLKRIGEVEYVRKDLADQSAQRGLKHDPQIIAAAIRAAGDLAIANAGRGYGRSPAEVSANANQILEELLDGLDE